MCTAMMALKVYWELQIEKKWDRNTLELALSLYMLKNVPLSVLEVSHELNPLHEEDIKRILNELRAEGGTLLYP